MDVSPFVEYGMAGMAFALVGVIIWAIKTFLASNSEMVKRHSELTERCVTVVERNTATIADVGKNLGAQTHEMQRLTDELKQRPCIIKKTDG